MSGYKRGGSWSKKVRCYSRDVSVEGCHREKVIVVKEDLARYFCYGEVGQKFL